MASKGRRFVTVYREIRCFGGYEEGGWYYSVYEAVLSNKCSTARGAIREQGRLNKLFDLYSGYEERYFAHIESKRTLGSWDNTDEPRPRYE